MDNPERAFDHSYGLLVLRSLDLQTPTYVRQLLVVCRAPPVDRFQERFVLPLLRLLMIRAGARIIARCLIAG
ncbi:hypothetical protein ABT090_23885, partial [Streptomyces asoensis]|uniref:hypothetical protein n=1 Tax=Streptomyces asoensis TaxID=249586 RepID=UPI00331671E9